MEASFVLHQIVPKITASIRKTKHNRDMDLDSIILLISFESHKSTFKCFSFKSKQNENNFYKLSGVVRHFDLMLS